jgi:mRNA interferase MazF
VFAVELQSHGAAGAGDGTAQASGRIAIGDFRETFKFPWDNHTQEGGRYAVVVTATKFIGSVVTVAPTSTSARPSLTRPEAEIDGRKYRILLEQMLGADITKLSNWIGVLDDHEIDARRRPAPLPRSPLASAVRGVHSHRLAGKQRDD